jgi:hypothetical protein
MRRKTFLFLVIALVSVLIGSSMLAVTQGWWPWSKPEYVVYNLKQVAGPSVVISMDNSGFPIIVVESSGSIIAGNITIDDTVYHYPNDFTYNDTTYIERNALTGEAYARVHKILTFKLPGNPTLESWLVTSMSGIIIDPNTGQPVNPANIHTDGQFKLTGTGRFASVDGFGLEHDFYHFGFIKGWPLR